MFELPRLIFKLSGCRFKQSKLVLVGCRFKQSNLVFKLSKLTIKQSRPIPKLSQPISKFYIYQKTYISLIQAYV